MTRPPLALVAATVAAATAAVVAAGTLAAGPLGAALTAVLVVGLTTAAGARLGAALHEAAAPDDWTDPGANQGRRRRRPERRPRVPVREAAALVAAVRALRQRVRVADDLAERHRRQAESASAGMFELLTGLVAAEEGARGQLSAELHDTVAQSLAAARRMLGDAAPGGSSGAVPCAVVVEAAEHVAEAEDAVRATMARTRPPALRDGDLAAAVAVLQADLAHRYGLDVELDWPAQEYPIPLATAVTVYRFFQEALLNVVKHADVDAAHARLEIDARHVLAAVRDEGPGFDVSTQPVAGRGGRHVGLGLLRERARLAGGSLTVETAPGAGTTLTLRLPRPALPVT